MEIRRIQIIDNEENFSNFMFFNEPVIIEGIECTSWPLMDYFIDRLTGKIDLEPFRLLCGSENIPIHEKGLIREMNINQFVDKLILNETVYAKDWHMFQYCPTTTYTVPQPFRDDWLNWFWKRCRKDSDDYRFVYIGGHGTFTGVHHDVLASYSWSINLFGKKRWTLWAPKDLPNLRSTNGKLIVSDARNGCYDHLLFPNVSKASPIIIEQNPHEAIFVPSGWYHMVENLDISRPSMTLSLNHNWFNGYSLDKNWEYLLQQFRGVYQEIEPYYPLRDQMKNLMINSSTPTSCSQMEMTLPEWYHHIQFLLKLQAGMNQIEFLALICIRLYIFEVIYSRNVIQSQRFENKVSDIALLRCLGEYLFREMNATSVGNEQIHSEYLQCCCEIDETDCSIVSNLVSHSINITDILSVPINASEIDRFLISFKTLRHHEFLSLNVAQINALKYCQIQVKCILLDILSSNDLRREIYHSICHELNCDVEFLRNAVTEYLEITAL